MQSMGSLEKKGLALVARQSALRSNGSTTQWRKIRQLVINRDGCCQRCGTEDNLSVDHIVPRNLGGDDSLSNLEVLCASCNSSKGGRFFDSAKTPPTLHGSFYPKNATESHYRLEKDEDES